VVVAVSGVLRQSERYGLQLRRQAGATGAMVAGVSTGALGRPIGTATVPNPVTGGTVDAYLRPFSRIVQKNPSGHLTGIAGRNSNTMGLGVASPFGDYYEHRPP